MSPTPRARRAAVALLGLALLSGGTALALGSDPLAMGAPFSVPWVVLAALYLVANPVGLVFPRRESGVMVTLVQLPLALGAVLVAPGVHVGVRLGTTLVDGVLRRQGPLKTLVNAGLASTEVGLAVLAVSLVPGGDPGPALWLALLLGLLAGEVASQLALDLLFRLLGASRTPQERREPLVVAVLTSVIFTGLSILTISAAFTDPWTVLVVLGLAAGLALVYRGHLRLATQQRITEDLYDLVKGMGPLDVEDDKTLDVLERVRELVHTRSLELFCADDGRLGRRLLVHLDGDPEVRDDEVRTPAAHSALTSQRMTVPLLVGGTLVGLLTARQRISTDRGFDMKDLRLLETVAAELATAIDRGRLLRELGRAASTDAMTGLPNLRDTTERLDRLLASHDRVLLAAIAVESFREVNDTLGHEVGDDLLRVVARRLREVAPDALIGRTGGGRFAVATVPGSSGVDCAMFGLSLRSQVEGAAQVKGVGTHVRLSVGCVCTPEHGRDAATLLRRAETAMYSARQAHGGPVMWEPAYEVQGQRRLAVVAALRDALATEAVDVAYQPKLRTDDGTVTGVEALVRWTHPALGVLAPDEFVPLAEAAGLMAPLTSTVLQQALGACRDWQQPGRPVGVAVNVTADTLQDVAFVTEVAAALAAAGVAPGLLTLELTEDVVVADPRLAAERMHELQALGVRLSVDDFGTGYSSLRYLKGLPIDEVKIDRDFVRGLLHDVGDLAVVRAVVDIAHTLGLRVVAEGVEQREQHDLLRRLGVDESQGFLHARPLRRPEMTAWLRRQEHVEHRG